jgi:hypothetical protein
LTLAPIATSSNVIGCENLAFVSANLPDSAVTCADSVLAVAAGGEPGSGVTIGAPPVIGADVPMANSFDDVWATAG